MSGVVQQVFLLTVLYLPYYCSALLPTKITTPPTLSHVFEDGCSRRGSAEASRLSASSDSRTALSTVSRQDGWNTERIAAARAVLISSESFQKLLYRVGVTDFAEEWTWGKDGRGSGWTNPVHQYTRHDHAARSSGSSGAAAFVDAETTAPSKTNPNTDVTPHVDDQDAHRLSWAPSQLWERNETKLHSLRSTVMESKKARDIKNKLRREGHDRSNGVAAVMRPRRTTETSRKSPAMRRTAAAAAADHSARNGEACTGAGATGKGTWAELESNGRASRPPGKRRADREGGLVDDYAGSIDGGNRGSGRREPPGQGWIRNVASNVVNVSKRARGRVARVVGRG